MRHQASFPRRAAAFVLALLLVLPTAYATAGEHKLQTSTEIVDGLTYRNTVTVNDGSRVESFALELAPDSEAYPILVQGDVTIYGGANIKNAVAATQARGYHVLGAINADFFFMGKGIPIGPVVENGVYKSSNLGENALAITDGQASIIQTPEIVMSLQNQNSGHVVDSAFNKPRVDDSGVTVLNRYYSDISTHTTTSGWYIRLKLLPDPETELLPELTVNSTLNLEVVEMLRSDQPTTIGADEYIITAGDASIYADMYDIYQVGDQVTLTTSCSDPIVSAAQWVCGVGDIMVKDGVVTDSSSWVYAKDGRQPRSALGIKADGTLVLYAVDGRQSGYSIGLSEKNLADELLSQGCVTAVNLDGGGSTSLSVWVPGQNGPTMRNSPSGGSARSCAAYVMLVTDQRGDGTADRLVLVEDGPTVLCGSSFSLPQVKAVDSGLNLVSADLSRLTYTSRGGLGTVSGTVYTAGDQAGTDTLELTTGELWGSGQIHVVNSLTDLKVTKQGGNASLTSLTVRPGEQAQLAVSGSYWGRNALWDLKPVSFQVNGTVGAVDENGLFTASRTPGSGSIVVSAGGMSQTVSVTVTNPHQDVGKDHWAYEAVEYCYEKGIVSGVSSTQFGPDLPIKRADFMVMLYNAMGKPAPAGPCTFTDVDRNMYYYAALSWAQQIGLATGVGGGKFAPQENITREQAFTLLARYLPISGKTCPDGSLSVLNQFPDSGQVADYARQAAATLVEQKLVSGSGGKLLPKSGLTRAEMVVMLRRVLEFTPGSGEPSDPTTPIDPPAEENPGPSVDYKLALDQSQITLASGGSVTLNAVILPAVSGAEVAWSSSDPNAATVSSTGMVTNLYPGTEDKTVTVTASWNGLSASCTVKCQRAQRVGTVEADGGLNVRSGPGTSYAAVGGLRNGAQVVVLNQLPDWYQILFRNTNGQAAIGYVSADYLIVN